MMLLSTTSKTTVGDQGAKGAGKHPGIITKGAKAAVGVKAVQGVSKHPGMITRAAKAAVGVKAAQGVSKHPGMITRAAKAAVGFKAAQGVSKHPGMITRAANVAVGVKAAQGVSKHPGVIRLGVKAGKPVARHKVRRRIVQIEGFGETAGQFGESLLVCNALIAEGLGLVERPKPRPAAPLFASGLVIGASAVYFLEPEHGREHRDKLLELAA